LTSDYREANELLAEADRLLSESSSPQVLAEFDFFRGPLLMEQGQPKAARLALDNAAHLYHAVLADDHMAGITQLQIARLLHYIGETPGAIAVSQEAITRMDPMRDPELAEDAKLNLSLFLAEIGDLARCG
jgi:tetratricopeptide (TPR) repeat protein